MKMHVSGLATAPAAAAINPAPANSSSGARTVCASRYVPQQLIKGTYAEFLPVSDLAAAKTLNS